MEKVEINTKIRKLNTKKKEFPVEKGKLTRKKGNSLKKVEINTKIRKFNTKKKEFPVKKRKINTKKGKFPWRKWKLTPK